MARSCSLDSAQSSVGLHTPTCESGHSSTTTPPTRTGLSGSWSRASRPGRVGRHSPRPARSVIRSPWSRAKRCRRSVQSTSSTSVKWHFALPSPPTSPTLALEARSVGPPLPTTRDHLAEWLADPSALKPMDPDRNDELTREDLLKREPVRILGMPDFGLSGDDIAALVDLLKSWE